MKNIYFVVLAILIVFYIISSIRKNRLSVKTSFGWIIGAIAMIILAIWPKSLDWLSLFIGISYPPALFLTLCVVALVVIDFNYSKQLEDHKKKIIELEQHIAILESDKNEKKINGSSIINSYGSNNAVNRKHQCTGSRCCSSK